MVFVLTLIRIKKNHFILFSKETLKDPILNMLKKEKK